MSVEPKPAELPLSGGRANASVRLHPLLTAEMRAPPAWVARPTGRFAVPRGLGLGGRRDWVWLPIPAFLVEHAGAGPILVDTGLHPSAAIDPAQTFGRALGAISQVRMEPEQAVAAQLRQRGIDPATVGLVLMTHLHWDHASGVSEFPQATFLVDEREWRSATGSRGALRGYRRQQFDYGFDWRTIDFDAPEVDSFETFGHSLDLLGDGSIRLLATPGHTLGHFSILLRLRQREVLLCGDAAFTRHAIEHDVAPLFMEDEHRFFRSLREIRRFVERTPELVAIPGHDREVWPTLEPVYD